MAGSNSPFSSGSSVSSILKSAESRAQKLQDFNDALVDYEWQNSAKTYSDFVSYENYLKQQAAQTADPMQQLTYTKKIDSGRSAYISNEIQRQSIDVIEGSSNNTEKYNRMLDLFYQAADAGQYDLAQSLHLQLDNLSVTIQNEQNAAASAARGSSSSYATDVKNQVNDAIDQVKQNANYAIQQYQQLGPDKFQEAAGSDLFSMLYNMVNSNNPDNPGLLQIYKQGASVTTNPSDARTFETKFNDILGGADAKTADGTNIFELPGVGGVSVKDISDQVYANSIGQTLFNAVQTGNGTEFKKNVVTGYQYGRDETGNYKLMPIYNSSANFNSQIENPNKAGQNLSYTGKNGVLANAGFNVLSSSGNTLTVQNNGEFNQAGIPQGEQVQLYVDANGNLQLKNGNQAYTLGFDKNGKYTGIQKTTPDYINLLPSGNQEFSRFNNRYIQEQLAKNPNFLNELPGGSIGLVDTRNVSFQPGMLIAQGMQRQAQIQLQAERAALAKRLQQARSPQPATVNPQRTVSPIGLPAGTRLTVAKPQPLPKLTVGVAHPQQHLTVGKANNSILFGGGVSLQGGGFRLQ